MNEMDRQLCAKIQQHVAARAALDRLHVSSLQPIVSGWICGVPLYTFTGIMVLWTDSNENWCNPRFGMN